MREVSLTPLALTSALLLPLAVTTPAQEVVLPLHDLLFQAEEREPYLDIVRCDRLAGSRRFRGETWFAGSPWTEDRNRLRDLGGAGYFTRNQLENLFQSLGLPDDVRIWNRSLVVPEQVAEAAKTVLTELRAALPPRLQLVVRLTEKSKFGERVRLERTAEIVPGRLHVLSDVMQTAAVLDYEVEIAQEASIANPVPADVRFGTMVAVRAQLAPSGQWGLLETVARCVDGDPNGQIPTGHSGLGPIDRARMSIAESGRVVMMRPGRKTVHRWGNATHTYTLQLETQWKLTPPTRVGGHDFAAFSMRGDASGFRSVPVLQDGDQELRFDPERDDPWSNLEDIAGSEAQWIDGYDDDDAVHAERFVAVDRAMWSIGAAVMRWFESKSAGPEITVTCYDAPAGAEWSADGEPAADSRVLAVTRLTQVDDSWSAAAVRSDYSVIRDWDVEVAGTARIPDPRCERVGAGVVLNIRRLGDRFELDGEISKIAEPGRKELTLSAALFGLGSSNPNATNKGAGTQSKLPTFSLPADVVLVEHPQISRARIRLQRPLAPGQSAIWRGSANGILSAGRELVAIMQRAK